MAVGVNQKLDHIKRHSQFLCQFGVRNRNFEVWKNNDDNFTEPIA